MKSSSESITPPASPAPPQSNKAYPWLLGISVCFSAALCYMYVTKPVIVSPSPGTEVSHNDERAEASSIQATEKRSAGKTASKSAKVALLPSDSGLPGMKPISGAGAATAQSKHSGVRGASKPIDPRLLAAAGDGSGWETTNSRVQHILSADNGNGELTKIVMNVPVLYQTRTMRWTPTDVERARDVLTRLMVYENNLSKLKQEGRALLTDWNRLLEKSVPTSALRADSPSLPYNHSRQSGGRNFPDSGSSIKVE